MVAVRSGCLQLLDGVGKHRRERTVSRAQAGREVRRLLVLGTGVVTTEAMRWCDDQRLPLLVARPGTAQPSVVGAPALFDHGGLRRAQALSVYTPVALEVTRWLLDKRLADQARIAAELLDQKDAATAIEEQRAALGACDSAEDALRVEAKAAAAYWKAWAGVEVTFAPRDRSRVPEHWRTFGGRRSPLSAEGASAVNRHAGDATNGLLNFSYWLAQSEAQIALLSMGLDVSLGFFHACDQNRPAAALDLMEAGRGVVEEAVLRLVTDRTWRKASFVESRAGEVRLAAPLSHELASALSPVLRETLGPVAEELAASLLPLVEGKARVSVPTPLSRSRHGRSRRDRPPLDFAPTCRGCGRSLPDKRRAWCEGCLPEARRLGDLHEVGPARRRQRARTKPYASEAAVARAEAMRRRNAERRAWEEDHKGMRPPEPEAFEAIRAGLHGLSDAAIASALGMSKTMAGQIRRGAVMPHLRHWSALAELAKVKLPAGVVDLTQRSLRNEKLAHDAEMEAGRAAQHEPLPAVDPETGELLGEALL
ncbi:MAG: CRISPR-associated endonuclease Cas1 [Acidimicrobiales bacterium]